MTEEQKKLVQEAKNEVQTSAGYTALGKTHAAIEHLNMASSALDALEAAGKCKSVPHTVTDEERDVYPQKKPGDQIMVCSVCGMEHGFMSNFCQWCGCEIEATE